MPKYELEKIKLEIKLEDLESLKDEIKSSNAQKTQYNTDIRKFTARINDTQTEINGLTNQKEALQRDKTFFEETISSLKAKNQLKTKLKDDETH